ncbi:hypothetical protein Tco_1137668 [Tanacetum coccineum]
MTTLKSCNKHNIVNWEYILLGMTEAKDSEVCKITRADGTSSFHGDFQALLRRLDRQDLFQLYSLVQERYKHRSIEGHDLDLWGDLKMMFDPNEEDDIWLNQHYWELLRWKLHEYSGVHSLFLDGTSIQINMLVDKKYPLKKEILKKMINLKIEAEEESDMASELIKFIKSQIAEQNLKVNHKFRGGLLGIKELLQDMLLKNLVPTKDPFNWNYQPVPAPQAPPAAPAPRTTLQRLQRLEEEVRGVYSRTKAISENVSVQDDVKELKTSLTLPIRRIQPQ